MKTNIDYMKDLTHDIIDLNHKIKLVDEMRDDLMFWKHLIQEEIYKLQDKELETCLMK